MNARSGEPRVTKGGTILTEEQTERLADGAEVGDDLTKTRRVGRPSLGETPKHSPHVSFRAPAELRTKTAERGAQESKTISRLASEAFEKYLAS